MRGAEFFVGNCQTVFEVHILRIGFVQFFKQRIEFFKKSQSLWQIAQCRVRGAEFGVGNSQTVFEVHILRIGFVQFFSQSAAFFKKSQSLWQIAQVRVRIAEFFIGNGQTVFEVCLVGGFQKQRRLDFHHRLVGLHRFGQVTGRTVEIAHVLAKDCQLVVVSVQRLQQGFGVAGI